LAEFVSGVMAHGSLRIQSIESITRIAYGLARASQTEPPGMGPLLLALIRARPTSAARRRYDFPAARIDYVDVGIPAGQAQVEFTAPYPYDPECMAVCRVVRIARRQSDEMLTMAYARACALFMAWLHSEEWADALIDAVAVALVMPEPALRSDMRELSVHELADAYVVEPSVVLQRMKMLHRTHDSGERPAVSLDQLRR